MLADELLGRHQQEGVLDEPADIVARLMLGALQGVGTQAEEPWQAALNERLAPDIEPFCLLLEEDGLPLIVAQAGKIAVVGPVEEFMALVRALAGENFAGLARKFSEYKETALIGGSLGLTELGNVDQSIYPAIQDLQNGEISRPTRLTVPGLDGYHIVLMKSRIPEHVPSLEQDYDRIEALALNLKRTQEYTAWLEELRTSIYWESRL